ncbi:AbrB/MazE/SpoVT family DNA-binding domain-containing protein [Candidatus Poriferisocius sp.]|uniref:AbrB/MazE/SpoVT family DNA-binding domain-containing protein n=1 Tax=Candidatus Poriferisocius sp. TaxID=3101276 RepID=UPI003B02A8A7
MSMSSAGDLRVSKSGQMSLPVSARRRWGLIGGGKVGCLDFGQGVLLVPGGIEGLRKEVMESVSDQDWEAAQDGFGDPDLASM